jgi:riboflavin kinase / FMN adenylyltransferase
MRVTTGIDNLRPPEMGSAITIGTFDGLHLGHRALISRTIDVARSSELEATVVTWDRHPFATLRPDKVPRMLSSRKRRLELIEEAGVDAAVILAFDKKLSSWPPDRFAAEVMTQGLEARAVVVGEGWRFGHGAVGDTELLRELGLGLGFSVETVDLTSVSKGVVSSSRVRAAVAAGDMELVRVLLGRPFDVDGKVVAGAGRGVKLGYPTANLDVDPAIARPARGAYAGRARARGSWYPAAISVGVAPTFGGDESVPVVIEAFLLDFAGDLYGEQLRVEFWKHLHEDLEFRSVDELVEQIDADVRTAREIVSSP